MLVVNEASSSGRPRGGERDQSTAGPETPWRRPLASASGPRGTGRRRGSEPVALSMHPVAERCQQLSPDRVQICALPAYFGIW